MFQRGLGADGFAEEFCQGLMGSSQQLGQKAEALSVYERFEKRMKTVLGVDPTAKTKAIWDILKESHMKAKGD